MTAQDLQRKSLQFRRNLVLFCICRSKRFCINTANIYREVELEPPRTELRGEGVFSDARRDTPPLMSSTKGKKKFSLLSTYFGLLLVKHNL